MCWGYWSVSLRCLPAGSYNALGSGPQPFWHQGLVPWKTVFPWTGMRGMVWGWFKHISFIAYFISIVITSASAQIIRDYSWRLGPLLRGHGLCLMCRLLHHPAHAAIRMHVNKQSLEWIRVLANHVSRGPPDQAPSWAQRRWCFPLSLLPNFICSQGIWVRACFPDWVSLFSPRPLNEGSAEAKGSCSEIVIVVLLMPAEFGFIIRGLYTRAGSLPVVVFSFFLRQLKTE